MRLLVVVSMYPHPGLPYSGIFNRNCVEAMQRLEHDVVVLAPRPYVPPFLKLHPRWSAYAQIPRYGEQGAVQVYRPDLIQVPRFGTTFQRNLGAFWQMKRVARKLHREAPFDAVFSFDLGGAGGLAWRLGKDLNIPSTGWAFGLDVRVPYESSDAHQMRTMLDELDLVFYQSSELRDCAQSYLPSGRQLDPAAHVVLPHGIPPMTLPSTRAEQRSNLSVSSDDVLILFLSRIVESKGIDELLTAFELAAAEHPSLCCIAVGETPGFDDSGKIRSLIAQKHLGDRFRLLPGCDPSQVPEYHAAADIFAFPSKSEGMPNALLEAMALGTPSVAFDIPPVRDILSHGPGLLAAKAFDAREFGAHLSDLAASEIRRTELASRAKQIVEGHFDITTNIGSALARLEHLLTNCQP